MFHRPIKAAPGRIVLAYYPALDDLSLLTWLLAGKELLMYRSEASHRPPGSNISHSALRIRQDPRWKYRVNVKLELARQMLSPWLPSRMRCVYAAPLPSTAKKYGNYLHEILVSLRSDARGRILEKLKNCGFDLRLSGHDVFLIHNHNRVRDMGQLAELIQGDMRSLRIPVAVRSIESYDHIDRLYENEASDWDLKQAIKLYWKLTGSSSVGTSGAEILIDPKLCSIRAFPNPSVDPRVCEIDFLDSLQFNHSIEVALKNLKLILENLLRGGEDERSARERAICLWLNWLSRRQFELFELNSDTYQPTLGKAIGSLDKDAIDDLNARYIDPDNFYHIGPFRIHIIGNYNVGRYWKKMLLSYWPGVTDAVLRDQPGDLEKIALVRLYNLCVLVEEQAERQLLNALTNWLNCNWLDIREYGPSYVPQDVRDARKRVILWAYVLEKHEELCCAISDESKNHAAEALLAYLNVLCQTLETSPDSVDYVRDDLTLSDVLVQTWRRVCFDLFSSLWGERFNFLIEKIKSLSQN